LSDEFNEPKTRISIRPPPPSGFVDDHDRDDLIIKYDGFTPQVPTGEPPWDDWRSRPDLSQPRIKQGGAPAPHFPDFSWDPGDLPVVPDGFAHEWPSDNPPWHEGGRPHPQPDRIREPPEPAPPFVSGVQTAAAEEEQAPTPRVPPAPPPEPAPRPGRRRRE
jgi:hypothetical protein